MRATSGRISDIMARLEQLEMRDKGTENNIESEKNRGGTWRPSHVIAGGWPERSPTELVERDAKRWFDKLEVIDRCLAPHAPRKRQSSYGACLAKAHFCIVKAIRRRMPGDGPPIERHRTKPPGLRDALQDPRGQCGERPDARGRQG